MENDVFTSTENVVENNETTNVEVKEAVEVGDGEDKIISFDSLVTDDKSVDKAVDDLNLDDFKVSLLEQMGVSLKAPVSQEEAERIERDEELQKIENEIPEVDIDYSDIEDCNLIIPKVELVRVLRYANVMIKKVTSDIEASSINITYSDEGKVVYKLKDNMTWVEIEGSCTLANDKPITKTLSFNVSYLTKFLTTAAKSVLFYEGKSVDSQGEEKEVLFARLTNGDLIVDVNYGRDERLVVPGVKGNLIKSIPATSMSILCDVMIPLINDTQEAHNKRVLMYNDRAVFRSSKYLLEVTGEFCNICLSKKELDLIKLMSNLDRNGVIDFYNVESEGENRILISVPGVNISTSVSIPQVDETTVTKLTTLENTKYIRVNKNEFKKVLFISGIGINSVARVLMNYNVDGLGIDAKIINKNGNSNFIISGENYNNLEPRSEDVNIYVQSIEALLKSFDSGKDLEVAFLNDGITLKDTSLNIYAIMNYAR